jgi:polysaccharide deacetylase 2 family uncharacterized protein YibQ
MLSYSPVSIESITHRLFGSDTLSAPSQRNRTHSFENFLTGRLTALETHESDIHTRFFLEDSLKEITAKIPRGLPIEWIVWKIIDGCERYDFSCTDCIYNERRATTRCTFEPSDNSKATIELTLKRSELYYSRTARIAFLVEDFGFEANQTTIEFLSFSEPLTVGLLPTQQSTQWTAQIANEYNKEIVIQLPLEPKIKKPEMKNVSMIMVHHTESEIENYIREATEHIPHFSGVTPMWGSRALEDRRVTGIIMKSIRREGVYFVESGENKNSVAAELAGQLSVPLVAVDYTLRTDNTEQSIEEQLRRVIVRAHHTGTIVVGTSMHREFIVQLTALLPTFRSQGVTLSYISDFIKNSDTES